MKFEIVESAGEWIVQRDGVEIGRFALQNEALAFVTAELSQLKGETAALSMRYERRSA